MAKMSVSQTEMMTAIEKRWTRDRDGELMLTVGAIILAMSDKYGSPENPSVSISVDDIAAMTKTHIVSRYFDPATKKWTYIVNKK